MSAFLSTFVALVNTAMVLFGMTLAILLFASILAATIFGLFSSIFL